MILFIIVTNKRIDRQRLRLTGIGILAQCLTKSPLVEQWVMPSCYWDWMEATDLVQLYQVLLPLSCLSRPGS